MIAALVSIDCEKIHDSDSFHDEFAKVLGFPDFYGRNMHAWVDCMTSIDKPADRMTRIFAANGNVLTLQLDNVAPFREKRPDLYAAIIECAAFVNWRRIEVGEPAVLAISFRN